MFTFTGVSASGAPELLGSLLGMKRLEEDLRVRYGYSLTAASGDMAIARSSWMENRREMFSLSGEIKRRFPSTYLIFDPDKRKK